MGEFELIARWFRRPGDADAAVLPAGDDAAVLAPTPGRELVTSIDTLVSAVHFPVALDAGDVGYRAVAVNVSDLAAMGARPRWMTLALTLPESDDGWLSGFSDGLYAAADEYGIALVGGDTTRGPVCVVTVSVIGDVEAGGALTRAGGQAGQSLFVSGTLGDAAAGLRLLQDAGPGDDGMMLRRRFSRPSARVGLGQRIAGIASACIDVSDGIVADAAHLASASRCKVIIELDKLPVSAELAARFGRELPGIALQGDDYELCFAVAEDRVGELQRAARDCQVDVTRIGRLEEGNGVGLEADGEPAAVEVSGYDHFGGAA